MSADLLDYKQAATYLKVSRSTLERAVRRGSIRCYKIGHLVRFAPEHLEEYLAASERPVVRRPVLGARGHL